MLIDSISTLATVCWFLPFGAVLVDAAPLFLNYYNTKRATASIDVTVVQFANLAEQLESQFYSQALSKFTPNDFTNAGFASSQLAIDTINSVATGEFAHVTALQGVISALGVQDFGKTCQFDFTSALVDLPTMLATARVLEFVGVSAYIGGAALIQDKNILNAAATILPQESSHSAILNIFNGGSFVPQAFDIGLTPPSVLSLAAGFITGGCDVVSGLGLTPQAALIVTSDTTTIGAGSKLTLKSAPPTSANETSGNGTAQNNIQAAAFCQMVVGGAVTALTFPIEACVVPSNVLGPVYIYATTDGTPLSTSVVTQNSLAISAGPSLIFVDPPNDILAQSIRTTTSTVSSNSTSPPSAPPTAPNSTTSSAPPGGGTSSTPIPPASNPGAESVEGSGIGGAKSAGFTSNNSTVSGGNVTTISG